MRFATPAGLRSGPGYVIALPPVTALNGNPHAAAWNMGTMGSTLSVGVRGIMASVLIVCTYVERCVYATPLGLPVVPDV